MDEKTIDKPLHISAETIKEAEIVAQKMAKTIGKAIYTLGFLVSLGCSTDEALQKVGVSMQNAGVNKEMKTNWIPVSERLPGTSGEALICDVYGYMTIAEFCVINKQFHDCFNGCVFTGVVAWMPLPEPYKVN